MFSTAQDLVGMFKGMVILARDPYQLDQVFVVAKGVERTGVMNRVAARLRASNSEVDQLVRERYCPPLADLDALARLPEGSLGRTFADNMKAMGYAVDFFPPVHTMDDGTYLMQRLRHTHDIWHTVTGFATDPAGEIGLQAFYLAQFGGPLSAVLIATGLLRSLLHPEDLRDFLAAVRRGWRMGRSCRS